MLRAAARRLRRAVASLRRTPPVYDDETVADFGVNVLGHFRYPSGLQVAALNTLEALRGAGVAVSPRDVPVSRATDLPGRDGYLGRFPYPVTLSQLAPEPFAEDAYERAGLPMEKESYRIGYWYWELEEAPPRWRRHVSWLHELWAPTRFVGDALRRVMPLPVVDMPPGIRMPDGTAMPRRRFGLPDGRFLFLFCFDMSSTFERKNPLAVVEAFRRAFRPGEGVALAIKVSRGEQDAGAMRRLRRACGEAGATLIDAVLSREEVGGLMAACDSYVSLHRAEGFGLTLAEAMALGKPVIATGYSGNLDFMNAENSLLVDHAMTAAKAGIYRGCRWAEPSVEHAAARMRWVFDHLEAARAMGERAARDVRASLSLDAAGRRMAHRLRELNVCPPRAAATTNNTNKTNQHE